MADSVFHTLYAGQCSIPVENVPATDYATFSREVRTLLSDGSVFPLAYFKMYARLVMILMDERTGRFMISSFVPDSMSLDSMGLDSLYQFERDISERAGMEFVGHPYPKPLRGVSKDKFAFSKTTNKVLHDVNVGPVHAGIIEPGRFRFTCTGEKVVSMEICLGYQKRGIESLIVNSISNLKRMLLSEQIAGDSVIANSTALATILENEKSYPLIDRERALALELERIAMHFSDVAALCGDSAYQLGQISVEPMRTAVINLLQLWCGSRSGRSLIRPNGSDFRLSLDTIGTMVDVLLEVKKNLGNVTANLLSSPSLLTRLEGKCVLPSALVRKFALRGLVAKASSSAFDIRFSPYSKINYSEVFAAVKLNGGDLLSRLRLRLMEADQSLDMCQMLLKQLKSIWFENEKHPDYEIPRDSQTIYLSAVEGFRGTILHVAVTDILGAICFYRVFDPSMLSWPALAYVMRGEQIADFPLCNKSFNLSYLANDL